MASPGRPERNKTARSFRQFRRFHHVINSDRVFGTHSGVRPPRGHQWNASTINGNVSRSGGLILNSIYAGRITWNRVRMVKDPVTRKRLSRPNPPDQYRLP